MSEDKAPYDALAEVQALLPDAESVAVLVRVDGKEHQFSGEWLKALLQGATNEPPALDHFEAQGR
jgi:hypothetical protein